MSDNTFKNRTKMLKYFSDPRTLTTMAQKFGKEDLSFEALCAVKINNILFETFWWFLIIFEF